MTDPERQRLIAEMHGFIRDHIRNRDWQEGYTEACHVAASVAADMVSETLERERGEMVQRYEAGKLESASDQEKAVAFADMLVSLDVPRSDDPKAQRVFVTVEACISDAIHTLFKFGR